MPKARRQFRRNAAEAPAPEPIVPLEVTTALETAERSSFGELVDQLQALTPPEADLGDDPDIAVIKPDERFRPLSTLLFEDTKQANVDGRHADAGLIQNFAVRLGELRSLIPGLIDVARPELRTLLERLTTLI